MLEVWPSSEKVRITASVVTISAAAVGVLGYFVRLDGRISQLEGQVRSLAASSGATAVASDRFDGLVSQLEEKMHSLGASSAATAAAITEITKKSSVVTNPILQKCIERAEEANTGQRNDGWSGPSVTKNAVMLMEKLGCNSTVR